METRRRSSKVRTSVNLTGLCSGMKSSENDMEPSGTMIVIASQRMFALPNFKIRMIRMLYAMLNAR